MKTAATVTARVDNWAVTGVQQFVKWCVNSYGKTHWIKKTARGWLSHKSSSDTTRQYTQWLLCSKQSDSPHPKKLFQALPCFTVVQWKFRVCWEVQSQPSAISHWRHRSARTFYIYKRKGKYVSKSRGKV